MVGLSVADAGRQKLTTLVLGSDQARGAAQEPPRPASPHDDDYPPRYTCPGKRRGGGPRPGSLGSVLVLRSRLINVGLVLYLVEVVVQLVVRGIRTLTPVRDTTSS
jgi:hypothetical protein